MTAPVWCSPAPHDSSPPDDVPIQSTPRTRIGSRRGRIRPGRDRAKSSGPADSLPPAARASGPRRSRWLRRCAMVSRCSG